MEFGRWRILSVSLFVFTSFLSPFKLHKFWNFHSFRKVLAVFLLHRLSFPCPAHLAFHAYFFCCFCLCRDYFPRKNVLKIARTFRPLPTACDGSNTANLYDGKCFAFTYENENVYFRRIFVWPNEKYFLFFWTFFCCFRRHHSDVVLFMFLALDFQVDVNLCVIDGDFSICMRIHWRRRPSHLPCTHSAHSGRLCCHAIYRIGQTWTH